MKNKNYNELIKSKKIKIIGAFILLLLISPLILFAFNDHKEFENNIEEGKQYIEEFKFKEAIKLFSNAVKKDPSNAKLHFYLGDAIRLRVFHARYKELSTENEKNLLEQAEEEFNKAIKIRIPSTTVRIYLCSAN